MEGKKHILIPTFPYPGGKAALASKILSYAPKSGRKFVDVFGGRGNILFHALAVGLDYREWIVNDINTAGFFRALRDHGSKFVATDRSVKEFDKYAAMPKDDPQALLMEPFLTFNGGRYHTNGAKGNGGGRRSPESYTQLIHRASELLREKRVRITQLDWRDCLDAENLGSGDFVAFDIPYAECKVNAYVPGPSLHQK
jgi:site-specific DNA-adenine methylase